MQPGGGARGAGRGPVEGGGGGGFGGGHVRPARGSQARMTFAPPRPVRRRERKGVGKEGEKECLRREQEGKEAQRLPGPV